MGLPCWPSVGDAWISPPPLAKRSACSTRSRSSVAWQKVRSSTQWNTSALQDLLQEFARAELEVLEGALIGQAMLCGGDDPRQPPGRLPAVPLEERLKARRGVGARALHDAVVAHLRGGLDRDYRHGPGPRLPEHLDLRGTPHPVDQHGAVRAMRDGALRPDAEAVPLPLLVRHHADLGIRDGEPPEAGLFADHVPHAQDGKAEGLRDAEELLLAAAGHAGDADDAGHRGGK